ncbi:MAG: aldo/keto reductase [Microthrixaceae bacterium]
MASSVGAANRRRDTPITAVLPDLPALAYGCWRLADDSPTPDLVRRRITTALDSGLTLIDTADIYGHGTPAGFGGAEALLGALLASDPALRGSMVLATKGGIVPGVPYDQSATYLRSACEASLDRLGADVIDLYFVHRPDVLTAPAELAGTLDALVDDGLVRAIGLSNFDAAHTRAVAAHLRHPLAALQPQWSLAHLDPLWDGTHALACELGAAVLAWSPLAGGALASLVNARQDADAAPDRSADGLGTGESVPDLATELVRLAHAHEVSASTVAMAWLCALPGPVIPIVGSGHLGRIAEAARAPELQLDSADWYRLLEAAQGTPLP